MNKGSLRRARGIARRLLGCDDILLPGALARVVQGWAKKGRSSLGCRRYPVD